MTRARNSANLASHGNLFVDITNDRTGIGSVVPDQNLHVAGTAGFHADTTFTGDLYNATWDRSDNTLKFVENAKLKFGDQFSIYKSSSHAIIDHEFQSGSYLRIGSANGVIIGSPLSHNQTLMRGYVNGAAELYYAGAKKLETTTYGTNTTGTAVNDGLVVAGVATVTTMNVTGVLTYDDVTSIDSIGIITARSNIDCNGNLDVAGTSNFVGDATFNGGAGAVTIPANSDMRFINGTWSGDVSGGVAKIQHHSNILYISGGSAGIYFRENNANRWFISDGGHFISGVDSTYDIGTSGNRVRNGYFDTLYGDGSNLTSLPAQATIANNADDRVITGGSGVNLNGEANLTYGSSHQLTFSGSATPLSGTSLPYSVNIYRDGGSGYGYFDTITNSSYSTGVRIRTYNNTTYNNVIEHTTSKVTNFQTDGSTRLSITSAGKVLVGDGSSITPSRNLDVRGTGQQQILIGSTNNSGASLMLDGHGGGDGSGGNYGTVEMGSDGHLDIRNYDAAKNIVFGVGSNTGAEDTLVLTSAGDLGLSNTGTNNPNNYSGWTTLTLNGSSGAELDFEKAGTLHGDIYANATRFAMTTRDSSTDIFFATKNNAGSTADRLQITSEGNIRHVDGAGVSYFNGASEYVFGSTGSSPPSGGAEANVQIHGHKTRAQFSINAYMNNAGGPYLQLVSSRSGTVGTLGSASANDDALGQIRFSADDGNGGVVYGAQIGGRAKSAATTNGIAGRLEFSTAKDSSSTTRQVFSMGEGGAFTAESESPALYGYYTSANNQNKYVDFPQWTRDSFICLEIFGNVNPNSAGSGAYSDPVHMYVYRGIGWTGSRVGYYIYCVSVAPPARHAFPSGTGYSGNAQISAVWTDGSSVIGNETGTSTHYMRLQIPNASTTYNFPKQFRIFRRR